MKKHLLSALAVAAFCLLLASPAAAVSVTIVGPEDIWVPYGECVTVTWTASTSGTVDSYDWAFEGSQVSTSNSYTRTFCSPENDYASYDFFDLEIWVTGGGQAAYDSHVVHPIYQAGDEGGDCGTQISCFP